MPRAQNEGYPLRENQRGVGSKFPGPHAINQDRTANVEFFRFVVGDATLIGWRFLTVAQMLDACAPRITVDRLRRVVVACAASSISLAMRDFLTRFQGTAINLFAWLIGGVGFSALVYQSWDYFIAAH